ncbi:unnamed protein product [Adineta ricciae]|uniref:N-acetyltransferase domain-containing protein n=1 Tax=Adineta ricciae TaxID=249248 RepID=A0A815QES9_ADIRI|nr:unnamed protein product [Adineta ricciae]CAF1462318.1 unnamed protein product [Adineta ricciae]
MADTMDVRSLFEDDLYNGLVRKEDFSEYLIGYAINGNHVELDRISQLVIECQSSLLFENMRNSTDEAGFLVHQWSLGKLKDILSSPQSVLICIVDTAENRLAGYLLLTAIEYLRKDTDSQHGELILDKNSIADQQWIQLVSSPTIHYIKQIGVNKNYHRRGIATHLINLAKLQSSQGLCTLVIVAPYCNAASANCFRKNQFQPIADWNQKISQGFVPFTATLFLWPSVISHNVA